MNASILDKFKVCKVCGKPLNDLQATFALRRLEEQACSSECHRRGVIQRFACCDKAVLTPCVCMYSFDCPVHGEKHIGTHD